MFLRTLIPGMGDKWKKEDNVEEQIDASKHKEDAD
jgi:hypothetical protein